MRDHKPKSAKKNHWRIKREEARRLAESYKRVSPTVVSLRERFEKRAENLCMCAGTFTYNPVAGGGKKLANVCFCKLPLCPICMWIRNVAWLDTDVGNIV